MTASARPRIAVLDYGIGNLRSAERALVHIGADARLVTDPDEASRCDGVVLPGVGAFGRCADALRASGLDRPALDAIEHDLPFLGICIGLQLLYASSEEDPEAKGLAVFDRPVVSVPAGGKRPQMQWNLIRQRGSSRMLAGVDPGTWFYFVHSYAPSDGPEVVATCDYGGQVTAAIEDGQLWGTQFHPEKSGTAGLALLDRFVQLCAGAR